MAFRLNRKAIAQMQGIGIIVILLGVGLAGVGYYYQLEMRRPPTAPRKQTVAVNPTESKYRLTAPFDLP